MEVAVLLDMEGSPSHVVIRVNGGPMQCVCDEALTPHYAFVRYRDVSKVVVTCGKCQAYVAEVNYRLKTAAEKRRVEREKEQAREKEGR